MLTLEQVSAVNDGFHGGDLNAALQPLEETIDLRVAELPRLDKKAVAALKDGLKTRDDAATWAQAVLHPNVSVRRFARKVFMGLGDEAAPVFAPLRARIERFWAENEPLAETNKPREAALRREQNEQVSSALEILLRADPEAFAAFYAQLADNAPAAGEDAQTAELRAWHQRHQAAWKATQDETTRLLREEWGAEYVKWSGRTKLPSRVLRELDERARAMPTIAKMWEELGDNPWQAVAPAWNPASLLMGTWSLYLNAEKPSGPTQRVNARLRPVLWSWLQGALDFERDESERTLLARRFMRGYLGHQLAGWLGHDETIERAPALLLATKMPLLTSIQAVYVNKSWHLQEGEKLFAALWLSLVAGLSVLFRKPYSAEPENWQPPAIPLETLRELLEKLPMEGKASHLLADLRIAAHKIEKARAAQKAPDAPAVPAVPTPPSATETYRTDRDKLSQLLGHYADAETYPDLEAVRAKIADIKAGAAQIRNDERVRKLVESAAHPKDSYRVLHRVPNWKIWSNTGKDDGAATLKTALWPRVEPQLWARLEAQLEAHRGVEADAVEPDIAQKLTESETKEWRARVRREKRQNVAADVMDIAELLFYVDGNAALMRAIELAERPHCREIREQLERKLFYQLEQFPRHGKTFVPSDEIWQEWKLDTSWDAVLARAEARLAETKDAWTRNILEQELTSGYYRRGDFASFENHANRSQTFPNGVALATVAFDDFEAWRVLLGWSGTWSNPPLASFWHAQQSDDARRARAVGAVAQNLATTSDVDVAKMFLLWLEPLDAAEFVPHLTEIEDALESPLVNVKKWAMKILSSSPDTDFDRERAAQTASEMLWSENAGLAKDAAKFLATLALQDESAREVAWDGLNDATSLENVGLCEAIFRALAKIKSKHKSLELSDAAREKLDGLAKAQSERFGKFAGKLN